MDLDEGNGGDIGTQTTGPGATNTGNTGISSVYCGFDAMDVNSEPV
jgi:hypothetical protein